MECITIEEAFKIRAFLKNKENLSYGERSVITNVLSGAYDRYKEESLSIAKEDAEYLNKD